MGRRHDIDWDAIERDFRLGQFTLRQLSAKHSINASSISRKAEKEKWVQDLSEEVRQKTRAALLSDAKQSNAQLDVAIEVAVETNVRIVREHRATISRARQVTEQLFEELRQTNESIGEITATIEQETRGDKSAARRMAMHKAVSLSSRAVAVNSLASAMKTFIGLERQAFGIDSEDEAGNRPATLADLIATSYRLQEERTIKGTVLGLETQDGVGKAESKVAFDTD